MTSLTDLDAAFSLLADAADGHAAAHPAGSPAADPAAELVHPPTVRPTRSWHRPALAAASVVLILALAIAGLVVLGPDRAPVRPTRPTTPSGPVDRSLGFTVDTALGMKVSRVETTPGLVTVQLTSAQRWAEVELLPRGETGWHKSGHALDVRGRVGWFVPADRQTVVDRSGRTVTGRSFAMVVWEYASDRWATVQLNEHDGTVAQLAPIARAIDFRTSTPLRTTFALRAAPAGHVLDDLDTTYLTGADQTPPSGDFFDYATTTARYADPGDGSSIDFTVSTWGGSAGEDGVRAVTVDGLEAYWNAGEHLLSVRTRDDVGLSVTAPTQTYAQIVALARTVTVVAHPLDRSSWFDARTAIPR